MAAFRQFQSGPMQQINMDTAVGALAASLGDPTRRGIYMFVREASEPITAAVIADEFGIHANVARHHLDRLADSGYLQVSHARPEGRQGPGAGRPAKRYQVTAKEIAIQFPTRRFDLLADLLATVVQRLDPHESSRVAEEVGREYGLELASQIDLAPDAGFGPAVEAVAEALTGIGFDTDADVGTRRLLYHHCPFGATATRHPEVICALDQGIVKGMMEALNQSSEPLTTPHAKQDEDCITVV